MDKQSQEMDELLTALEQIEQSMARMQARVGELKLAAKCAIHAKSTTQLTNCTENPAITATKADITEKNKAELRATAERLKKYAGKATVLKRILH